MIRMWFSTIAPRSLPVICRYDPYTWTSTLALRNGRCVTSTRQELSLVTIDDDFREEPTPIPAIPGRSPAIIAYKAKVEREPSSWLSPEILAWSMGASDFCL